MSIGKRRYRWAAKNPGDDCAAMFTAETFGERVTEQRIGPCGFGCPMQRRPPGGIGNVGDEVPGV
jgi:hypothetical protein